MVVVTPRRPRSGLVLAVAVALLLAAGTAIAVVRHRHHGAANQTFAPGLHLIPLEGRYGMHTPPGLLALSTTVDFEVTAPITLLDVRPYRATSGVETIARAYFYGSGISPSGHPMFNGAPGISCSTVPWPPAGYGPSFPVSGLVLAAGDPVRIGFYIRAPAVVGRYLVTGYRIRYRTANGKTHTVTGDLGRVQIDYLTPEGLARAGSHCDPREASGFFEPRTGYPN